MGAKDRLLGRVARQVSAAAAGALAIGLVAVSGASARVQHDPCGTETEAHVTPDGLHCGRVIDVPGHRTITLPHYDGAPRCSRKTEVMKGLRPHPIWGEIWDYWTKNGEWVLWNGRSMWTYGALDQPIDVFPELHNFGLHPWPVRVFFRCRGDH